MSFSRVFQTEDRGSIAAQFTRIHAPVDKFFIELLTERGEKTSFEMIQDEARGWSIRRPAPDWVFAFERKLAEAIQGKNHP